MCMVQWYFNVVNSSQCLLGRCELVNDNITNKLEQSTTVTAPHQLQDIKTKCKVSYFELVDLLLVATRPPLQPAWYEHSTSCL